MARDIGAGRALLERAAHNDIFDFVARHACAFHGGGDHMAAELGSGGVVERAPIRLANRCPRNRNNNSFSHEQHSETAEGTDML